MAGQRSEVVVITRKIKFGFEDLEIWQKAVEFARTVIDLTEGIHSNRKHFRLIEQLETASASIAMNIAEGKGRYSKREYMQFLYIARGSLFETITLLIIFNKNKWINDEKLEEIKGMAEEISKMLAGLISYVRNSLTDTYHPRPKT